MKTRKRPIKPSTTKERAMMKQIQALPPMSREERERNMAIVDKVLAEVFESVDYQTPTEPEGN